MNPNVHLFKADFQPGDSLPQRPVRPIRSVMTHRRLAITILLLGISGSAFLARQKGNVYSASCTINIASRFAKILHDDKETDLASRDVMSQYILQQAANITRRDVMEEAVRNFPDCKISWQLPGESLQHAAERLSNRLIVQPMLDRSSIRVAMDGRSPDGLAEIVNVVVHIYARKAKGDQIYDGKERVEQLIRLREDLVAEIERKSTEMATLAAEVGAPVFHSIVDPQASDTTISTLTDRRAELVQRISGLAPANPARVQAELEIAQLEHEIKRLTPTPEQRVKITMLRDELTRLQNKMATTSDRIDFLTVEADAPGLVRVGVPARRPVTPTKARTGKILIVGLMTTFALVVLIPVFIDLRDSRIYNAKDLERVLGFPSLGWMPDASEAWQSDFLKVQRKRMAFALERARRQHNYSVFLFTSVTPEAGTSFIIKNLSEDLNAAGVKTIIITVNHKNDIEQPRFDAAPEAPQEVEDAASAPVSPESALVLSESDWTTSLLTVREKLDRMKELYDVILIDTGPLLLSSVAEHMIGMADATLIVVRAGETMDDQARSVAFHLQRLIPNAVGSIVNGVSLRHGIDDISMAYRKHVTKQGTPLARFISRWLWS